MAQFTKLKKQRDVECLRIKEASNLLHILNSSSPYAYWSEKLLAEKVLLTSGKFQKQIIINILNCFLGYTVDLLVDKIRNEYTEIQESWNIGTISIDQCTFNLEDFTTKGHTTEFFVLLFANGINVRTSKIARAFNGELTFDEKFEFLINADFNVKVQIFSLVMRDAPKLQKLVTRLMQKVFILFYCYK